MSHRESSCDGKRGFRTFAQAVLASKRKKHAKRVPYHCTYCNQFHIGTRLRKPNEKKRRAMEEN